MLKTLAIASTLSLPSVSAAAAAEILLIVGTVPVWNGDATVINLLRQQGHTVQVVDDDVSTTANANGKNLVILSSSVTPASVGNKFNQVPVPVIVYRRELFRNLGLTGTVASTDFGFVAGQTQLQMTGTHALTGGLAGTVTVGSAGSDFTWGKPGAAAVVAATLSGDASRAALFGYEAGALLKNSTTAPARRVATYLNAGTVVKWTADGQTLFNAAVQWALDAPTQTNQAPVVNAGPDKAATAGVPLSLAGAVTDDGVALPLTIAWQPLSGASFANASNPTTSVTFASAGVYVLELRASDPQFSDSDTVTITVGSSSAGKQILFIVGTIPIPTWSGDVRLIDFLQQQGHTVQVVDDDASTTANADGKHLVIVSASVNGASVGNKFNRVPVPVIVHKRELYDNLGLTGTASTAYGYVPSQTQLKITGTHALTGGLVGTVTVGSAGTNFSWGKPGAAAAVVAATLSGDASRAALFAYEAGALLANSTTAPARRVATYLDVGTATKWTANGQTLFNAALQWALNEPPPPPLVRILPLGDSITNGKDGYWSFRRDLAGLLTHAECAYDMVGTLFGPATGSSGSGNFDRDHEGHGGYRTDQILPALPAWLAGNEPDWILIHLGTNDVLQGRSISTARENLSAIIDTLRAANADVGILLAQIIPNKPANEAAVVDLNTAIASLAAAKNMPGVSPVILVNQYSGYDTFVHNYDQIHPNAAGEAIIAGRWHDALQPQIAAHCGN